MKSKGCAINFTFRLQASSLVGSPSTIIWFEWMDQNTFKLPIHIVIRTANPGQNVAALREIDILKNDKRSIANWESLQHYSQ